MSNHMMIEIDGRNPKTMTGKTRSGSVAAVIPAADDGIAMGLLPALVGYHVRQAQMAIFANFDAAPGELGVSPGISAPASGPP